MLCDHAQISGGVRRWRAQCYGSVVALAEADHSENPIKFLALTWTSYSTPADNIVMTYVRSG